MKRCLAVVALLAASTSARASTVKEVVDNWVDAKLPQVVGLCIGAYDQGTGYYRCAGQSGNGPLTTSTLMAMASVTKTFTAADLATLLVRNRIALNDDISTLAPAGFGVPSGLTVKQLASQASGLPEMWPQPYNTPPLPDDNFADMASCMESPECWAGPGPSYSNFGYGILGAIVARALGLPNEWFAVTQDTVLTPLGMNFTAPAPNYASGYFDAHAAWGFTGSAGNWVASSPDLVAATIPGGIGGEAGGALWTTAGDMQTWLKFNMGVEVGTAPQNGILYEARSWLYQRRLQLLHRGG